MTLLRWRTFPVLGSRVFGWKLALFPFLTLGKWLHCLNRFFGKGPLVEAEAPSVGGFPPHFTQASLGPPRAPHELKLDIGSEHELIPHQKTWGALGCGM